MATSTPILYANRCLFCILTGIWWRSTELGSSRGSESRVSLKGEGRRVCRLVSPEIEGIMKNSAGTSKQTSGHFLW